VTRRTSRSWPLYGLMLAAVGVLALGILDLGPPSASASRTSQQTVTAEQGVVQSTVSGTGSLEPATDLDLDFKTSGTLAHVYVKAGQTVAKGKLLASLDRTQAQITLDQADLALSSARSQLAAAEDGTQTASTTAAITSTSAGGSSPSTGSPTAVVAQVAVVRSATTLRGTTGSAGSTIPATPSTTTTASTTTTTKAPSTTSTTTPASKTTSTAPSTAAKTNTGTSSATSSADTIATDRLAVDQDELTVKADRLALSETRLYAPTAGTIASLASISPGGAVSAGSTSSASTGSTASSSTGSTSTASGGLGTSTAASSGSSSFVELVNTRALTMQVAFSESDITKVKVGQSATVSIDALPNVELAAHVSAIATLPTTSGSVVSYDATVTVDQTDAEVRPGMSATALVIVAQAQGVTVTSGAVTGSGSLASVNVVRSGKATATPVVVGLKGETTTQIISGLTAGQQVLVTTVLPSASSTATASASSTTSRSGAASALGTGAAGGFGGTGGGFAGGGGTGPPGAP
jgi:multidrug efflux pump subunit AcrA (membrane-fusion protein)